MPSVPVPLCWALLAAASLYGQQEVAPEAAGAVAGLFQPHPGERTLACAIHPVSPVLTFRLIYRAGYSVTVSMEQLIEEPRTLAVLTRITPKQGGAQPLLLKDNGTLPAEAGAQGREAAKFEAQVSGGFYLGEGEYHVELVVAGSGQRICRKQWDVALKPQKGVLSALPPGTVAALSRIDWPRAGGRDGSLTLFVHAAPARDNPVLLESTAAVLDRMPFRRARAVAFSLDQHKELAREDLANPAGFRRLAETMHGYNPATVSYGVLQDTAGHREFLWQLLAREELRAPPDDLVIFVGYSTFDDSHVFVPPACAENSRKPLYVYLQYALPRRGRTGRPGFAGPRTRRGPPSTFEPRPSVWAPVMPDAVSRVTRACSGKVFPIYSPADLASALQKIDALLSPEPTPQR